MKKERKASERQKSEKKRRDSAVLIAQFVKKNSGRVRSKPFSLDFSAASFSPTPLFRLSLYFLLPSKEYNKVGILQTRQEQQGSLPKFEV